MINRTVSTCCASPGRVRDGGAAVAMETAARGGGALPATVLHDPRAQLLRTHRTRLHRSVRHQQEHDSADTRFGGGRLDFKVAKYCG